jgi:hypothetical protein
MAYSLLEIQRECDRLNLTLTQVKPSYFRKEKVLVHCDCGGERGVSAFSLFKNISCCRRKAKLGGNNPARGKDPWNKGRRDLSGVLTGRPEGSLNSEPCSDETRQKYRDARKRLTENGQPWSGFKNPKDKDREDTLYLVLLKNLNYKVGRSYKGAKYRKSEVQEVLGEWKGKSEHIWEVEGLILSEFKEFKTPMSERSNGRGMTEWFQPTLPVKTVIQRITALLDRLTPPLPSLRKAL